MKKSTIIKDKWQRIANKLNKGAAAKKSAGRFSIFEKPSGDIVIEYNGKFPISGTKMVQVGDAVKKHYRDKERKGKKN